MTRADAAGSRDRLSPPVRALLRQQAEDTPDRTVLVTGQEKWSSRRLAEQAGRLAAGLRRGMSSLATGWHCTRTTLRKLPSVTWPAPTWQDAPSRRVQSEEKDPT